MPKRKSSLFSFLEEEPKNCKIPESQLVIFYYQNLMNMSSEHCQSMIENALLLLQIPVIALVLQQCNTFQKLFFNVLHQVLDNKYALQHEEFRLRLNEFRRNRKHLHSLINKKSLWELFLNYGEIIKHDRRYSNVILFQLFVQEALMQRPLYPTLWNAMMKHVESDQQHLILCKMNDKEQAKLIATNTQVIAQRAECYANIARHCAKIACSMLVLFSQ